MIFALFLACGDNNTDTAAEASIDNPYLDNPATFTEVENELLGVSCAFNSCHAAAAGGLSLDGQTDYERIMDVNSPMTGEALVVPGDADASYLYKKIIGTPDITGDIMPPGVGVSQLQEQMLESWINDGAQNN